MQAILAAQSARAERMSKDGHAAPPASLPPAADCPPPRGPMVASLMELGHSRASAETTYDRQLAAWRTGRGIE